MVNDELRRGADEWREIAAKLRLLARQTRSIEARGGLLELAERFEELARRIAGADRCLKP
jgi:hypothetical protein